VLDGEDEEEDEAEAEAEVDAGEDDEVDVFVEDFFCTIWICPSLDGRPISK